MLELILNRANLLRAWKRVRANCGAAGVDGVIIEDFPAWLRAHWCEVKASLLDDNYRPAPVKRHDIPKRSGGKRPLGIPTVLDRVIQQAILQALQPLFDPEFSESSYGFRPGRSAHDAVKRVREILDSGYMWVVDIDLSKFFDRVNHDVLMARVARKVRDKRVLRIIGRYLRAGVEVDGKIEPTTEGVPQGGPLSPLLANIVLDDFDKELEQRGHRFVRYADDFLIFVRSKRSAVRVGRGVTIENLTKIGKKCKLETGCYITVYSEIEDYCFIAPNVTTSNDNFLGRTEERFKHFKGVTVRRGGRIGAGAVILPGIEIGADAVVAAGSVVTKNVPPQKIVLGMPAKIFRDTPSEQLLENQGWD